MTRRRRCAHRRASTWCRGAEFDELRKSERVVFLIENRKGLSWEEHPFVVDLSRELRRVVTPISFSVP